MKIEYRAWDNKEKRWFPNIKHDEWINVCHDGNIVFSDNDDSDPEEAEGRFDILQYIGFKDKNEKKIYVGDILYHSYFREVGVVEFYQPRGAFMLKYKDNKHQELYPIDKDSFEVIGNIYENPELLKRKHDKEKQKSNQPQDVRIL